MAGEKDVLIMNKMKLLIGLLVVGIVLLGGGLVFLLRSSHQVATEVTLTPSPGSYLFDSQNEPSEVLLQTIQIEKSISNEGIVSTGPAITINSGDPIWVLSGNIQNNHPTKQKIDMYADGYDAKGKQVAWTLDAHIVGQREIQLENGETGAYILILNYSGNVKSFRIYASNSSVPPP
jgi:hypothetical protein